MFEVEWFESGEMLAALEGERYPAGTNPFDVLDETKFRRAEQFRFFAEARGAARGLIAGHRAAGDMAWINQQVLVRYADGSERWETIAIWDVDESKSSDDLYKERPDNLFTLDLPDGAQVVG